MRHDKAERLDEVLRIVEAASEAMTPSEIAEQTDYNERSVQRWLSELAAKAKVVRVEGKVVPGHGGEPDRWRRPGPLTALLTES
jgi:DeoR/GlpR family transcriptional regulator of sugar metabolism